MVKCSEVITAMNIRQVFVSRRVNTVLRELTECTSNITSISPKATNDVDPVLSNAIKGLQTIWGNCFDRSITDDKLRDILGLKLASENLRDIVDLKHWSGIWGCLNKAKKPTEIVACELKIRIKRELKFLVDNIKETSKISLFKESIINPINRNIKRLDQIKSAELRHCIRQSDPILITKSGLLLDTTEASIFWTRYMGT